MDRKAILLKLRQEGKLKGLKPCFVSLRQSKGGIYNGASGTFIMSIRDNFLYFQKLSPFLHRLQPREDFKINFLRFKEYYIEKKTVYKILNLYSEGGSYLDILYQFGTRDTFASEDNLARILKILNENNVKEIFDNEFKEEEIKEDDDVEENVWKRKTRIN